MSILRTIDTSVTVFTRGVYGQQKIYPANDVARKFAALTGTKTFNLTQLQHIKALGYTIEQVIDPNATLKVQS